MRLLPCAHVRSIRAVEEVEEGGGGGEGGGPRQRCSAEFSREILLRAWESVVGLTPDSVCGVGRGDVEDPRPDCHVNFSPARC